MSDEKQINVALDDIMPVMREQLSVGGSVTFGPKGTSMLPLIRQNIDSVVISPVSGTLKKYDVPLYQRADGHYVLHRIVGVKGESYVMCGDNQFSRERGITDKQIIGVMTAIIKPEGKILVTDKGYVKYARRRVLRQSVYGFVYKVRRRIARILKNKR